VVKKRYFDRQPAMKAT